jgi:hypothetical protein
MQQASEDQEGSGGVGRTLDRGIAATTWYGRGRTVHLQAMPQRD